MALEKASWQRELTDANATLSMLFEDTRAAKEELVAEMNQLALDRKELEEEKARLRLVLRGAGPAALEQMCLESDPSSPSPSSLLPASYTQNGTSDPDARPKTNQLIVTIETMRIDTTCMALAGGFERTERIEPGKT